ncbi:MAG: hypothetical protein Tsb009_08470 [Planctomycetaceae bacterium]
MVGARNVRTKEYKDLLENLPSQIRELADDHFQLFLSNPNHPSLRLHKLENSHMPSHRDGSYSVSITMRYRAIFVIDDDTNVWYWVGSHTDYNKFTGRSR